MELLARFNNMRMTHKVFLILSCLSCVMMVVFGFYNYDHEIDQAREDARKEGLAMIKRSAEMFMVSTRRFSDDFDRTKDDPQARRKVLDDWNRTIFAVDMAVTADHGADQTRVRLTGDTGVYGYAPLGGENTALKEDHEIQAAQRLLAGEDLVETEDGQFLRLYAPLWSDAHIGCAQCHFSVVENDQADMNRHILLGSVNAYVPIAQALAGAREHAALTVGFVVICLVVLMGVIHVFLHRALVKPIESMVGVMQDIAEGEGDLTARLQVNSQDEVGQVARWFNTFVEKIQVLVSDVSGAAGDVAATSAEIAASSQQIAEQLDAQNRQMLQISSAVEEMSCSVIEVARQSSDASMTASQSGEVATQGGVVVKETIEDIHGIHEAVTSGANSVNQLGVHSEQIGQVISVINDIADQTNLLALNAAIEAARAGEYGRGFAVVADEVRKLADRTTKATDEVAQTIKAIQSETQQAVQLMGDGTGRVQKGLQSAACAGDSLREIVDNTQRVSLLIESIAAAAEEQSASGEEISRSVESISLISSQVTEGAGQAAQAAVQLSQKAEQLQAMVGRFRIE